MRWIAACLLLTSCGGGKPCPPVACIVGDIPLDLPLSEPGTYVVEVSSPGVPTGASCQIEVGPVPPPSVCAGMKVSASGAAVKGVLLPSGFAIGGLLDVTRDAGPFLSGSFDVHFHPAGTACGACQTPYAVVYPGQGS